MTAPIVVCSKGRPDKCPTLKALAATSLQWRVTLEREDVEAYVEAGVLRDNIIELAESNRGIYYTRRQALEAMRKIGVMGWVWMLDDDISRWFSVVDKRCRPCSLEEALSGAEAMFTGDPSVALGALEYQQLAWSADRPIKFNGYADVAVCVHLGRTSLLQHRDGTKEDRDFAMQVIAAGYRVARVQKFAFGCPPIGTNAGGLHDWYAKRDNVLAACNRMVELWGTQIITVVEKKNGLPDAKINWRKLAEIKVP